MDFRKEPNLEKFCCLTWRKIALMVTGIDKHRCNTLVAYSSLDALSSSAPKRLHRIQVGSMPRSISREHICSRRGCSNVTDMWSREIALISKIIDALESDWLFGRMQEESKTLSRPCLLRIARICGTCEGWLKINKIISYFIPLRKINQVLTKMELR